MTDFLATALFTLSDTAFVLCIAMCTMIFSDIGRRFGMVRISVLSAAFAVSSAAYYFFREWFGTLPTPFFVGIMALLALRYLIVPWIILGRLSLRQIYISLLFTSMEMLFRYALFLPNLAEFVNIENALSLRGFLLLAFRASMLIFLHNSMRKNRFQFAYATVSTVPKYIFVFILLDSCAFAAATMILRSSTLGHEQKLYILMVLMIVMIIFTCAVIFSLLYMAFMRKYQQDISKILENQVKNQLAHYEQIEKNNKEMRSFRHDYINHLTCINAMLSEGSTAEAVDYISKLTKNIPRRASLFDTGNRIADALLNEKAAVAAKEGIELTFDGIISDDIESMDLCTILSNALDNALEACRSVEDNPRRYISVIADVQRSYFMLEVENTMRSDIKLANNIFPKTSKETSEDHGLGLYNIRRVADKYGGAMQISVEEGNFLIGITLKLNTAAKENKEN